MEWDKTSHLRPLGTHWSPGVDAWEEMCELSQCEGVKLYQMDSSVTSSRPLAIHYNSNNFHLIFKVVAAGGI